MSIIQSGSIIESVRASGVLLQPDSQVFVVDPNDLSNFSMQDAIDATVAGNGDIIVTLPGGILVTSTVNFNKSGIRVMSLSKSTRNPLVNGEFHAIWSTSLTGDPVAIITKPCVIDGIGFAGADAGALFFSGAALLIGGDADANPFGVQLINCRFPKWGLDNRIGVAVEGSTDVLIEECTFEGVGSNLEAGIYMQGAIQNITIRNNYFRQCDFAIEYGAFAGGGPHAMIHGNQCEDSKLLDAGGFTAPSFVYDNWLETATDTGSYNASVATLQGQGIQFAGNHYSE